MSCFSVAIPVILQHEGVWSDNADDKGGPTHFGISLRFLQTLTERDGQGFMLGDSNHDGVIDREDIVALTQAEAIALYYRTSWVPYGYERITAQPLATKIFDLTVNMGSGASHRCLQRAVRAASGLHVSEDGILGPQTLQALNTLPTEPLLAAYRSEAAGYYRSLHQPRFEAGWLNRAYA